MAFCPFYVGMCMRVCLEQASMLPSLQSLSMATIPHRSSPPALLLRASDRQDGTVTTRPRAPLTPWPPAQRAALRRVLRGDTLVAPADAWASSRRRPQGPVVAVLGTLRRWGFASLLAVQQSRQRDVVVALSGARLSEPPSQRATARSWHPETAFTSRGPTLGGAAADARALSQALAWCRRRPPQRATAWAKRPRWEGTLALSARTATACEGPPGPWAPCGHARAGTKGQGQLGLGLVGKAAGGPGAVAVCAGTTGAPTTVAPVSAP